MKVLVASNHLSGIGGSESYTYDLLKAIKKKEGIEIEYFTFERGELSDKIEDELQIPFMQQKKYNLILANHNTTVKELFSKAPIIQICHGTVPELEQPSPFADFHIAVSEEISESLTERGYANEVILNGVDVQEKKPLSSPNTQLNSLLSLCQSEKANNILRGICEDKGIQFRAFNKNKNAVLDIAPEINKSDVIIGIGRSIYDAMACGRPCVIYDQRGYNGNRADGYLRPNKFSDYVKNNCSGRFLNRTYSKCDLIREIDKYDPSDGHALRTIAINELNAYKMADRLLNTVHHLDWENRIKKWGRFSYNLKQFKRIYFYKRLYQLTKNEYFNR